MDLVEIVTLADDAYGLPLAVMVRSLLEHLAPGRRVRIVIVDGGLAPESKRRLVESWQDAPAWPRCEVAYATPEYGAGRALPAWGRVSPLTFARLGVAEYVPAGRRRIVLLDSDTLVLTDIGRLAETSLDGATVAAAQDPFVPLLSSVGGLANHAGLGLRPDAEYFNAGVMLIDVERWRADRVGEQAFAFTRRHLPVLRQYDQDSLNAVLAGRWLELDPRWQVQPRTAHALGRSPHPHPYLVHFSGRLKPWLYRGRGGCDESFWDVVDRTAWRGVRPERTLRSVALRLYDSPLRRLVHPLEKRVLQHWQRWMRPRVLRCQVDGDG